MIVYMAGRKTSHPELVILAKYHLNLHTFFSELVWLLLVLLLSRYISQVFQLKTKPNHFGETQRKIYLIW